MHHVEGGKDHSSERGNKRIICYLWLYLSVTTPKLSGLEQSVTFYSAQDSASLQSGLGSAGWLFCWVQLVSEAAF